jgi:hypothetical protein
MHGGSLFEALIVDGFLMLDKGNGTTDGSDFTDFFGFGCVGFFHCGREGRGIEKTMMP